MSKFNIMDKRGPKARATSPITSEPVASGVTHEGAPGYARDAKSELFLLAVSNMVGEGTFYEAGKARDGRYAALVHQVAVADPVWMLGFLGWLRGEGNMRSASLVGAAEAVFARLASGFHLTPPVVAVTRTGPSSGVVNPTEVEGWPPVVKNRQMIAAVLQRADEPGELLAYWTATFGRAIPQPVKRGVADAVRRLYNEYGLLKYDTASHGFRFADVIDLVHPTPSAPWQGDLFRYALDRRHGRDGEVPESLSMVWLQGEVRRLVAGGDYGPLLSPSTLHSAGMTWEDALSLAGSKVDKARLWAALAPTMGYMALLRNLRNFDEAGLPDEVARQIADRLADPEQVARSRQLPMRFLSAYRAVPSLRWGHALDKALNASLANVPALPGRTLVLVDVSGSMRDHLSARSDLTRADAAAVFASAVALRAEFAELVWFNDRSGRVAFGAGASLLKTMASIPRPNGGTYTQQAVAQWFGGHDRVIVVTDEQAHYGGYRGGVDQAVPATVPFYTWNLGGYERGHTASGSNNRHTFGGLSDAAFRMVPLLEAGRNATWPWLASS